LPNLIEAFVIDECNSMVLEKRKLTKLFDKRKKMFKEIDHWLELNMIIIDEKPL
jgi:hypothetical protein